MIFQYGLCSFALHRAMTKNGIGIGELGVLFILAEVREWKHSNAFFFANVCSDLAQKRSSVLALLHQISCKA
jgi:hypothetical protein